MGDSITEGWITVRPDFFSENNYINHGVGGQTTNQILKRFPDDVTILKPVAVVILAGINDFLGKFEPFDIEKTKSNLSKMAQMSNEKGIKVILCSLLPVYEFPTKKHIKPATQIEELNQWIESYAKENDFRYVDYHSAMKDEKSGLKKEYTEDGIHPNIKGYDVMKPILEKVIDEVLSK